MDGSSSLPAGLEPEDIPRRERFATFYGKPNHSHFANGSLGHQVNTYWTWIDVQRADRYLAQLERMQSQNASGSEYVPTTTSITAYLR
jgi:hypothetical protein